MHDRLKDGIYKIKNKNLYNIELEKVIKKVESTHRKALLGLNLGPASFGSEVFN